MEVEREEETLNPKIETETEVEEETEEATEIEVAQEIETEERHPTPLTLERLVKSENQKFKLNLKSSVKFFISI